MILHSTQIGNRSVHVRTDDCDQQELERVHETVRLVTRMCNRDGNEAYGLLLGLVAFFASAGIELSLTAPWTWQGLPSVFVAAFAAVGGWFLVLSIIRPYQQKDAVRLQALTTESIRCRDFVLECTEASTVLSSALGNFVERPQTA